MAPSTRTFRVFVSSTFSDLKAERNALQERVFPRLRELAAAHGCRFQAIDLRWGVSDEASLDQQAMNICLGEIARCQQTTPRPNFIVLLGDRYGWCPLPYEVPFEEYDQILPVISEAERALVVAWYRRDDNALPALYILQPRMSELSSVPSAEFQRLTADPDMTPEDREILERWYKQGQVKQSILSRYFGEIPPGQAIHTLQPVTGKDKSGKEKERSKAAQIAERFFWQGRQGIEPRLHSILERTTADFADDARLKYSASATEQEIAAGALQVRDAPEHVLCFFRSIDGLPRQPGLTARDFLNLDENGIVDEAAREKQNDLKERLQNKLPDNVYSYRARWTDGGITTGHIDQLCKDVYESLSRIILGEIEHPHEITPAEEVVIHIQPDEKLDTEGLIHHRFAEERLRFFVGRVEILVKITDYLKYNKRRILAIIGTGGTGKSALVARAIQQSQEMYPEAQIVYRFIGVTPGSSDGRSLLDSLCHEISRHYGAEEEDIPTDYRDLVPELRKRMQLASVDRPLILFLDSLDQLSASQGARNLIWLPDELPEHVAVIVSTRPEDTRKALRAKQAQEEKLGGLSRKEGEDLLSQWLVSVDRTLQELQQKEVLDKFESEGNPLYLKLAFEEARLWTSGSGQPPEPLEAGLHGIIEKNLIHRLKKEANHGAALVSHALGYLAASRYGLAEDELLDLLSRDLQVYEWFFKKSYHMPVDLRRWAIQYRKNPTRKAEQVRKPSASEEKAAVAWFKEIRNQPEQTAEFLTAVLPKADGPRLPVVLWSRLSFDLAPYLTERMVDGNPLLNFYHRELGEVASAVFLAEGKEQPYHERLAYYFNFKADPQGDGSWTGNNPHGLSELPYHLTKAASFEKVYQTLIDFKFLEHKAAEVGVLEREDEKGKPVKTYTGVLQLQEDYERALAGMLGGNVGEGDRAPLILTTLETSKGLIVYCPVCNSYSPIKKDMLDTVIACPQEACKMPLKVNPFTVKREL